MNQQSWSEWFIYDLKLLKRTTRRIGRSKSYLVLTPAQRENLANTMQETINALEQITNLCKPKYKEMKMLSKKQIKDLEIKYGKHKFCYQCGNPSIILESPAEGYYCPKCGSSDSDE